MNAQNDEMIAARQDKVEPVKLDDLDPELAEAAAEALRVQNRESLCKQMDDFLAEMKKGAK
jgi:hypothetical protein